MARTAVAGGFGDDFRKLAKIAAVASAAAVLIDVATGKKVKPVDIIGAAITIIAFLL